MTAATDRATDGAAGAGGAPPVAIVGMSVLFPGAPGLDAYWRNLLGGVDAITDVPAGRWDAAYYTPGSTGGGAAGPDRVYCRRGGFVDEFAEVEAVRFGITPSSVSGTEPDQLIALKVAAEALDDAGGPDRLPAPERVGVVLGRGGYLTPGLARLDQRVRTAHQLTHTLAELLPGLRDEVLDRVRSAFVERLGPDRPEAAIGLVPNLAASRVANRLDLRGPVYTVDAACASSLVAVDQAVGELASGRCDVMLAGGVHHCHDITLWSVFSQLRALSPSQRIRPFHRGADGVLIGEGTGVVVLKRLADALRDGDRVYAVVRGTGVAGDGRAAGLTTPDPGGQTRAVRQAWRTAGLDPREPGVIGLLEAHGTGTPAGDTAELATVSEVFGPGGDPGGSRGRHSPVIGSVKSMIGHTMPAAGVAGLVKAALALHHGRLLPTLHCDDPHPALAATRFRTLDKAEPWETGPGARVRRAAVNAFGFGGINAHVVLEEAPSAPRRPTPTPAPATATAATAVSEPEPVLALAAATPEALGELLAADDTALRTTGADGHRTPGRARLGIVAPTAKRLALARRVVAGGRAWRGRGDLWFTPAPLLGEGGERQAGGARRDGGTATGGLAFVFPGLEAEFAPQVDGVAAYFGLPGAVARHSAETARVGDVGRHGVGVFAVGRLLDRALRTMGLVPDALAGHSIGEWTAMAAGGLCSGEAIDTFLDSFDPDALRVPGLAFAALGASAERVVAALDERPYAGTVLSHDNAPHQSMVCGPRAAVEEFVTALRAEGVIAQVLPFQSGFHTPMLAPYLESIKETVGRFELLAPATPVWSATTAAPYPRSEVAVRELFVRHLLEPVRFRALTEALYASGVRAFVQVGTGQLASLIGDTLNGSDHLVVAAGSARRDGVAQLRRVATALWAEGARVDPALPRPATVGGGERRATAPPPSVRPASLPPVRLDLGGSLVSLGQRDAAALRAELSAARPSPAPGDGRSGQHGLTALAGHHPLASELDALLRETADTAAEVMVAAATLPATSHHLPAAPAAPRNTREVAAPRDAPATTRAVLSVSTRTMPYLLDHCFFPQRPGWPDETDRRPVVPATTILQHLMDAAERTAPGRLAVAVHGARFDQWVAAAPPVEVPVTVTPDPGRPDHFEVTFGDGARGTVETASAHPADRPTPWRTDPADERTPDHTAAELYDERWMFHGPAFQGLTRLTAIGASHVRGTITTPSAPGALLDNVGQLLGYWIMATRTERTVVFPVALRGLRLFGPPPAVGTAVECVVRIVSLSDTVLEADMQLLIDGVVWAELTGWQDRRFDNHPSTVAAQRFPQRDTLSGVRPGGWVLVHERWPDLASRDLIMRNHLGAAERAEYERHAPRGRRQWLLGRIAAKDAVRQWLWEHGEGPVFPAEIRIQEDERGRPCATGVHGRTVPELEVSLAHRDEAGVALVRARPPGGRGVLGIGIEAVMEAATGIPVAGREREALAAVCDATGVPEDRWAAAFRAAHRAVTAAEGTPADRTPPETAVVEAGPGWLVAEVSPSSGPSRRYRMRCAETANPPGLPVRYYAVAWTTGTVDDYEENAL
ncbi:beta-ketoacyl synthase N-terminal-like domain-containing protein [Streptomyces sp. NPDC048636]|uniref:beta-ketoacyl synthase N-terminal-like domain-containing protein n=1 Tax=Streptomyces sp. NPDC048636 TaxID=3155762 RepID=UPI003426D18F